MSEKISPEVTAADAGKSGDGDDVKETQTSTTSPSNHAGDKSANDSNKEQQKEHDAISSSAYRYRRNISKDGLSSVGSYRKTSLTFSDPELSEWSLRPATEEERLGENGPSPETALPVDVRIWLKEWRVEASGGLEMMRVKFDLFFVWTDYRLANWSLEEDVPHNIWRPELFLMGNGVKISDEEKKKVPTFRSREREDGCLEWNVTSESTAFDVLASADALKMFPFDSHRYDFLLCLSGDKRMEGTNEVKLRFKTGLENLMDVPFSDPPKCSSGDFDLVGASYAHAQHKSKANPTGYQDVVISLHVKRNPKFYLFKTVFPLYAIVVFGGLNWFLDVTELGNRLNLIFAMFLTCFALQWIVLDRLPRVPYMTVLDLIISMGNACLLTMGVGSAITSAVVSRERFGLLSGTDALTDSQSSRKTDPAVNQHDPERLQTADKLDRGIQIMVFLLVVASHLYFVYVVRRGEKLEGKNRPWSEGKMRWIKEITEGRYLDLPLKSDLYHKNHSFAEKQRGYLGVEKDVF